jgi:3'(2'), 5'-bisphosphate nucleotidase
MEIKNYQRELIIAKDIALRTWQLIAPFYDQGVEVENKVDGTPVTKADKLANNYILERISKEFPLDSIVSEENQSILNGERTWYVDPIDGTRGFIKRNGQFAIHIGFCENDEPLLRVVYAPILGDMYYGLVGQGAWRENQRGILELKVKKSNKIEQIASTNGDKPKKDLISIFNYLGVKAYHNIGSEGLRLMKIAEGIADVRITEDPNKINTWDVCAPHAIIRAYGGFLKYLDGTELLYPKQREIGRRYVAANSERLVDMATFFKGV